MSSYLNESARPLLATALLDIVIRNSELNGVNRALLDPGSHFNFISAVYVKKLELPQFATNNQISAIENLTTSVKLSISIIIKIRNSPFDCQ